MNITITKILPLISKERKYVISCMFFLYLVLGFSIWAMDLSSVCILNWATFYYQLHCLYVLKKCSGYLLAAASGFVAGLGMFVLVNFSAWGLILLGVGLSGFYLFEPKKQTLVKEKT
jgi:hypothetical protein